MSSTVFNILLTLGTLYACCAVARVWAAYSIIPHLSLILQVSAYFWAIYLTLCLGLLYVVTRQCAGNWLYGYTECEGLSDATASTLTAIGALSFAGGIICGALLLVIGGLSEVIMRNRAKRG